MRMRVFNNHFHVLLLDPMLLAWHVPPSCVLGWVSLLEQREEKNV